MNLDIEYANFALWFLLAMVYWKVTLQVIVRWKWTLVPFAILYATHRFFITDLNYFDIGRAITFSFFFYLGHFAKAWTPPIIQYVQKIQLHAITFPIVGVCGLYIITKIQQAGIIQMKTSWFYGKFDSFTALLDKQSAFELIVYQVQITLFSLLMVGLFLLIVPTKEYLWTGIGTVTLSVYLLHGFVRNIFVHHNLLFKADTWGELFALASLSLLIVFVFSRKPCHSFVAFLSSLIKKKQN